MEEYCFRWPHSCACHRMNTSNINWCTDDCNKLDLCVVKRTVNKEARSVTMAIHGFQKVKASIMWAASVVTTAMSTQITFLPVLSTKNPKTGEAGAEMMYTMLAEIERKENNRLEAMKRQLRDLIWPVPHFTEKRNRNGATSMVAHVRGTCSQLGLRLGRSWISQWRTP